MHGGPVKADEASTQFPWRESFPIRHYAHSREAHPAAGSPVPGSRHRLTIDSQYKRRLEQLAKHEHPQIAARAKAALRQVRGR